MNSQEPMEKDISRTRKILFKIITISIPVIFLFLVEALLRLSGAGENLDLFIQNPTEGYEDYMIVNPLIGEKYFQKLEYTSPPNDIFLKDKPDGTFRIFVMGSSTVVGFPYGYNLMFSRILHKRLEDLYPGKKIEMVNTAITAINSYTLWEFSREILKYEPDAILFYAGHNEFYGAFGIASNESIGRSLTLTRLHFRLMDLRIYQLLRKFITSFGRKRNSKDGDDVRGTLMKRIAGNKCIPFGSEEYDLSMDRYRQNVGDILEKMKSREIPVFMSELICNLKNTRPFSYVSTGKEDEAWAAYLEGAKFYNEGDFEEALLSLGKARDLDCVRFRASGEMNGIILELADKNEAFFIPMTDYFSSESPHGITGDNLLTEHVHPNIDGSFLMADAFYTAIVSSGILGNPDSMHIHSSTYYRRNWGYTILDSLLAVHRVNNLKNYWPFVPFDAERPDYREVYHTSSFFDSVAFRVFRDPEQSLQEVRLKLAQAYEQKNRYYEAYREYEAILRTNPYLSINYRDAARMLINLQDLPLALEYFKRSMDYEPTFFSAYRMGEIFLIKSDYENSILSFEEAYGLTDDRNEKIKCLGRIYIAAVFGNFSEKAESVKQQLQQSGALNMLVLPQKNYVYGNYIPYMTRDLVNRALEYRKEDHLKEAADVLVNSLNIYDSHIARRYLGEIFFELGDITNARKNLENVFDEFRFDPRFLDTMIRLNVESGQPGKAGDLLQELKMVDPGYEGINVLSSVLSSEKEN